VVIYLPKKPLPDFGCGVDTWYCLYVSELDVLVELPMLLSGAGGLYAVPGYGAPWSFGRGL